MATSDGGGNCFSACLASILEFDLEEVPHFVNQSELHWFHLAKKWLYEKGLELVWIPLTVVETMDFKREIHYIGVGYCEDGGVHAVVVCNDEEVHNPSPSIEITQFTDFYVLRGHYPE